MDPGATAGGTDVVTDGESDDLGPRRRTVAAIAVVSLGLYAANVATWAVFEGVTALATPDAYLGLLLHGVVLAAVLAGVWHLGRHPFEGGRYPRIRGWHAGGLVAFLALNLALIAAFATESLAANASWAVFSGNIGGVAGLTVGIVEARAIDRAVRAEREAVHAASLERQRDWLEYINRLLRHEILNNVQVVQGQVGLLYANPTEDDAGDRVETIQRRLSDMTDVVEDVREVIRTTSGGSTLQPVALPDVLRDRLAAVSASHENVETDLRIVEAPNVPGDVLLPRIFDNLFENAVEHSRDSTAHIDVTVDRTDGVARVTVADDGPGISDAVVESLFEPSGGTHGMGLHLVDVLAVRYGGSVELVDTSAEGTTFVVELPVSEDDEPMVPGEVEPNAARLRLTASDTAS